MILQPVLSAALELLPKMLMPNFPHQELKKLARALLHSEEELDKEVRDTLDALGRSSDLVRDLERRLEERAARLTALKTEHHRLTQLSSISKEQAAAIVGSVEKAVGSSALRERLWALAINIGAGLVLFVFGIWASDWVKSILGL